MSASGTAERTSPTSSSPLPVGARRERAHRFAENRAQRKRHAVQLELARFDLRKIKHVVDDDKQAVRRGFHRAEQRALVLGERRVQRELGHAENRVHRGANLVTHVGQELVLRAVRCLGGLLGVAKRRLGRFELADVDDATRETGRLPRRVADGDPADERRANLASLHALP
jgi:hypothetical protein